MAQARLEARLTPKTRALFEKGLRAEDPTSGLSNVVRRLLKDSGMARQEILDQLELFRGVLKADGRDEDEDVVLEVMDFLVGWASPHVSMASTRPDDRLTGVRSEAAPSRPAVPRPSFWFVRPGTSGGVWTDRQLAVLLRERGFPATAVARPTVAVLDLTGVFPTPGVLQDLVLPLGRRIRGGEYGPLVLMVKTHDTGVADFVSYLAKEHDLPLFVAPFPGALSEATPAGDLTSTEYTTLNIVHGLGGAVTASVLAESAGIEPTAAGNRLAKLYDKGYIYRFARPRREGDVYMDPRTAFDVSPSDLAVGAASV